MNFSLFSGFLCAKGGFEQGDGMIVEVLEGLWDCCYKERQIGAAASCRFYSGPTTNKAGAPAADRQSVSTREGIFCFSEEAVVEIPVTKAY